MSNRIPLVLLGMLVLAALIWRIANPPAPTPPGPLGLMPSWTSTTRIGDLAAHGVSPDGARWAGVWTETNQDGSARSAAVIIDLVNKQSQRHPLGPGCAASLFWRNNSSLIVLLTDNADPGAVTTSRLVRVSLRGQNVRGKTTRLHEKVAAILAWPAGSNLFVARLAGHPVRTAVLDSSGKVMGKETVLDVPDASKFYHVAALSPDQQTYAFAVETSEIGGQETFYLAHSGTGAVEKLFVSTDLPGVVEDMWISPKGLLIVASERGKIHVVRWDPVSKKIVFVSKDAPLANLAEDWPGAPASLIFAAYDGAYQTDLKTGISKRVVRFDTANRNVAAWSALAQDGRLYRRKDGDYTSVSYAAGLVDIRIIAKNGERSQPLLPRR